MFNKNRLYSNKNYNINTHNLYQNIAAILMMFHRISLKGELCQNNKESLSIPTNPIIKRNQSQKRRLIILFIGIMTLYIFMLKIAKIFIVMRKKILMNKHIFLLWKLLQNILIVEKVQDNNQNLETNWAGQDSHKSKQLYKLLNKYLLHLAILHKVIKNRWIWQKQRKKDRNRDVSQV